VPSSKPVAIFACQMCGDCCHGYGGTVITAKDSARIAAYLGIGRSDFQSRYCGRSGSKSILAQKSDGRCIFFDEFCTIHPVKPRMCRLWPYLPAVLTDVRNWRVMADVCPGMRTDVSEEEIIAQVKAVLKAEEKPS